jgi:hypothetical protein
VTPYTFTWDWKSTMGAPPVRTFSTNTGTWGPTVQAVDFNTTSNEGDAKPLFLNMNPGDHVRIEEPGNPAVFAEFELAVAPVDYGSYFSFPAKKGQGDSQGVPIEGQFCNVIFMVGYTPVGDIPTPVFISASHGYGDNNADTLYAICNDGTLWARSIKRDSGWQSVSRKTDPIEQIQNRADVL